MRKPSRREFFLLGAFGTLAQLASMADTRNHDRNPNCYAEVHGYLERAQRFAREISSLYLSEDCEKAREMFAQWLAEERFT